MLNPHYKEQCKLTSHAEERLSFKILTHIWLDHKCMMAQVPKFRFSGLMIFHNLFLYICIDVNDQYLYTWKHFFFKSYLKHVKMTERKENGRHTFCHRKDFSIQSCTLFLGDFTGILASSHPVWMDIGNINMSQGPIYLIKNIKSTCPKWHDWAISENFCKSLSKEIPNSTAVLSCFLAFVDS